MKVWFLLLAVVSGVLSAHAAQTLSVKDLVSLVSDLQQQGKSDGSIAEKLMDVKLSEELTPAAVEPLRGMNLGAETLEQIRILAVESALLPPPASDLPATTPPDAAAQKAMIDHTIQYLSDFMHSPKVAADKTTVRYQNGPDSVYSSTGGTQAVRTDLGHQLAPDNPYLKNLGEHTMPVEVLGGAEMRPAKIKAGDPSTQNGQISQGGPGPLLGVAFEDAAKGQMQFARWETIGGKALAVFSFEVPKKQSHYEVNYCCFPKSDNVGSHMAAPLSSSASGSMGSGSSISTASSVYATNTVFDPFRSKVGYHGEFFIDPETGEILRFVMQAEMKKTDFVRQEDTRIDYGSVTVDGKAMILPQQSFVLTTVIPTGDSEQRIVERRTLFEVQYANYRQPGS